MSSKTPAIGTRLLVVCLDGADGRLLDLATRDGSLPNLSELRRRGRAWRLSSAPNDTDDSLWASFQYGVELGEHGRISYFLVDDRGKRTFAIGHENDRETFWDRLSAQGYRVAVLDVPKSRQPRPLNGIHLADWLVHGRYFQTPHSYPDTLASEVVAQFGAAPPSRCGYSQPSPLDHEAVREITRNLSRSVEMKRDAGLSFLSQGSWDLFIIGFKESHCACHMFWDLHDPDHRRFDAQRAAELGDPILEVLKAQDRAIGDLIAMAGPDAQVMVFSTSDFCPNGVLAHLFDQIAERLNDTLAAEIDGEWPTRLRRLARVPRNLCRAGLVSDNVGALRVPRLAGESPQDHRKRVEGIAGLARELVDADNGEPVITAATYPAFDETGRRADGLPPLLLHYRSNLCPSAVTSPRLGRISAPAPHERAGNHLSGGMAFAAGGWAEAAAAEAPTMTHFAGLITRVIHADRSGVAP